MPEDASLNSDAPRTGYTGRPGPASRFSVRGSRRPPPVRAWPPSPTSPAGGRAADARAECRRAAGPGRERGSTWRCREQVVGVSTCASHSKLSPTTVLRPDRRHRVGQGADPSRPSPGSPRAVAGVASGRGAKLPAPHHRPIPPCPAPETCTRPFAALPARPTDVRRALSDHRLRIRRRLVTELTRTWLPAQQAVPADALMQQTKCLPRSPSRRTAPLPVPDSTPGRPPAQDPASTYEDRRTHVRRSAPWGEARCQRGAAPVCWPR